MRKILVNSLIMTLFLFASCGGGGDSGGNEPKRPVVVVKKTCEYFGSSNYGEQEFCQCPATYVPSEAGYYCERDESQVKKCSFFGASNYGQEAQCFCPVNYVRTGDGYSCDELPRCLATPDRAVNSGDVGQCSCNTGYEKTVDGFDCVPSSANRCDSPYATNNGADEFCSCTSGYLPTVDGYSCYQTQNICLSAHADNLGMAERCDCHYGYIRDDSGYSCDPLPICKSDNASNFNEVGQCECNVGFEKTPSGYSCQVQVCKAPTNVEASNSGKVGQCECNVGYQATEGGYNCEAVPTCISPFATNETYNQAGQCVCIGDYVPVQDEDGFNWNCEISVCNDPNASNQGQEGSCICNEGFEADPTTNYGSCVAEGTTCLDANASNQGDPLPCSCESGYALDPESNGSFCGQLFTFEGFDANGGTNNEIHFYGQFDEVLIKRDNSDPAFFGLANASCAIQSSDLKFNLISYSNKKANDPMMINLNMNDSEASLHKVNTNYSPEFDSVSYTQIINSFAYDSCTSNQIKYSSGNGEFLDIKLSVDNKYAILKYTTPSEVYVYFGVDINKSNKETTLPEYSNTTDELVAAFSLEKSLVVDFNGTGASFPNYVGANYGDDLSTNMPKDRAWFASINAEPFVDEGDHYRLLFSNFSLGNIGTILGPYKQNITLKGVDKNDSSQSCTEPQEPVDGNYVCDYLIEDITMEPKTTFGATTTQSNVEHQGFFLSFYTNDDSHLINIMSFMPQNRSNYVEKIIMKSISIETLTPLDPLDYY